MLLSRGRAAFFGIFVLAWSLPSCFGADGSSEGDDDDTTGGTESSGATGGSSATGGSGPGTGGSAGSGANGGSSDGGTGGGSGGSGGSGGNVVPPLGGTAGSTSGTGGSTGGASGAGGTGGTSGSGPLAVLGSACASDADCDTGFCLTSDSTELEGAGPADGMCTLACADQSVCDDQAPGTVCLAFTETVSFCFETCEPGTATVPKCQSRDNVGCVGIGTFEGTTPCETIDDCQFGEICFAAVEGEPTVCSPVASACLPTCAGDFECGPDQFCDFLSGLCVPGSPTGLPIGSQCDPAATTDPCAGFCIAISETAGMCSGSCTLNATLASCGYDGSTPPADAICMFSPVYVDPADVGQNDAGLCGPLCDCNDDCAIEGWACFDIDAEIAEGAATRFGRAGLCRALAEGEALTDGIACGE